MSKPRKIIRGGVVVDGDGGAPYQADVLVDGGVIAALGVVDASDAEEIDAAGCLVTPGFVDVHTHYDGQAIWSPRLSPSSQHGVTTVVFGNCGVGFAPCRPADHDLLVNAMEGVEDIPGVVMTEGLPWDWETFPQFLDALDSRPHDIDLAAYLPHSALRVYAMGERGANCEPASAKDLDQMCGLAREAAQAGAAGFASSLLALHKRGDGAPIPSFQVSENELTAIAKAAADGGSKVFQLVPNVGPGKRILRETIDLVTRISRNAGVTVTFTSASGAHLGPVLMEWVAEANENPDVRIRPQILPKPVGIVIGYNLTTNPFMFCPSYQAIAHLPLAERIEELRKPAMRAALLSEQPEGGLPVYYLARNFAHTFPIRDDALCEPIPENSVQAMAERRGVTGAEMVYDLLLEDDGHAMLSVAAGDLGGGVRDDYLEMMRHRDFVVGLGDGGAHYGMICDAGYPTAVLSYWARDRERGTLKIEEAVRALTSAPADAVGFSDRGRLAAGKKADINVIEFDRLHAGPMEVRFDLPSGGRRLHQGASGYRTTLVSGEAIVDRGERREVFPGRLVRRGAYLH